MFKALFDIIIGLLATVIQLIVWPINAVITATMPDISSQITQVGTTLGNIFTSMGWAVGLIPAPVLAVLVFVVTCEIAKHTVFMSTHMVLKVWNVLQKIKFW